MKVLCGCWIGIRGHLRREHGMNCWVLDQDREPHFLKQQKVSPISSYAFDAGQGWVRSSRMLWSPHMNSPQKAPAHAEWLWVY